MASAKSSVKPVFGQRLKQARERAGISQTDLARIVGLQDGQAISAYESGRVDPKLGMVEKIAAALGVRPAQLADWT